MPTARFATTTGLYLLIAAAGCTPWPRAERVAKRLPQPQMSPDAVVLEIATVRVPPEPASQMPEIWKEVDEQHLPTELRRRLAANGLRCGIIGAQLPESLRALLDREEDALGVRGEDGAALRGPASRQQRLQCQAGRRAKIIVTPEVRERMPVLICEDNRIRGDTYEQAQCVFAVRTFPQGDGRVRIELTPEVQHGPMKQRYVGQEGGVFRLDADQAREVFRQLLAEATLAPGQTLLVTNTPHAKGLGRQFFVEESDGVAYRKLLLIRLAQTQIDDLFAPGTAFAPIATPTD